MFRIMISALRFLLDYENLEDDDDSDASSSDDEDTKKISQVVINREAVYKVNNIIYFIHLNFTIEHHCAQVWN